MNACDVKGMLKDSYEDPSFFVNFYNIGRGIVGDVSGDKPYIQSTKTVNCWKIFNDILQKVDRDCETLFDSETYIFQWVLELTANETTHEESLFYYWKGNNASKGYSPLPPEIESENPAVERICQWSEPALFFHMFSQPLTVINGAPNNFNPEQKRLFIIRGELLSEIHLYEVPCTKDSLRSRGIFLLLSPNENTGYLWCGSAVSNKFQQLVSNVIKENEKNKLWANYKILEVKECEKDDIFYKSLVCQTGSYIKLSHCVDFTPKLFYFNSITGDFLATEVEYPLRCRNIKAPFPFLQSHLYTADQPALFLLDNDKEIWLWEGWKSSETNIDIFKMEIKLAKETANEYAEKKGNSPIPIKYVLAGLEPLEFINIFPYWTKQDDLVNKG